MDLRIEWSPEAAEDSEKIAEYISRDSEFYARAVVTKIIDVCGRLDEFALSGRIVPELADGSIRERIVYNYRLVYRVEQERILIIAIIHGKQLLEGVLNRTEKQ